MPTSSARRATTADEHASSETAFYPSESRGLVDVAAITRAAAAISGKIVVDDVVVEVIEASVMNAGATRGLLLLARGDEFVIQGEANRRPRRAAIASGSPGRHRPSPAPARGPSGWSTTSRARARAW